MTNPVRNRIISIVEPVCQAAGYGLVDVRFRSDPSGYIVQIFVEALDGHTIDINDCETVSRELSAVLDVEDPIAHAYNLEVSSPGLDRPLRTEAHFQRFVGSEVKIVLAVPLGDRRNFKGLLTAVEHDDGPTGRPVAVVSVDGVVFRLAIADMESARIVPDWDSVFRSGRDNAPRSKKEKRRQAN